MRICLLGFSLRSQSIAFGASHLPALSVRLPGFTALHPSENPLPFTLLKQVFILAAANRHKCSSQKTHPSGCLFFGRVLFRSAAAISAFANRLISRTEFRCEPQNDEKSVLRLCVSPVRISALALTMTIPRHFEGLPEKSRA